MIIYNKMFRIVLCSYFLLAFSLIPEFDFNLLASIRAVLAWMVIFFIGIYMVIKKKFVSINILQTIVYFIAILIWTVLGIYNGYFVRSESLTLLKMFLFFYAVVIACNEKIIRIDYIRKLLYAFMIAWGLAYLLLFLGFISNNIPIDIFYNVGVGFLGLLPRIGAGINICPLIIYGIYVCEQKGGSVLVWILMFFLVLMDFGRVNMVFFFIMSLMFLYYKVGDFKINVKGVFKCLSGVTLLILFGFYVCYLFNVNINEFWEGATERFNYQSYARIVQGKYLEEYAEENIIVGRGMGAYVPEYLRNDNKWIYELQFHAFVMQFGVLGFIMIVVNYMILFLNLLYKNMNMKYFYITSICVLAWIINSSLQGSVYQNCGLDVCSVLYIFTRNDESLH